MTEGIITDEAVAALRSRIGIEHPRRPWNEVATKDAIRHFAHAYGDTNPLWTDEEYARKSRYGCIVAPPTFLFTCSSGPVAPTDPRYAIPPELRRGGRLAGVGALHAGDEWEFYHSVLVDDRLAAVARLVEVEDKIGRMGGRQIHEIRETVYTNQRGEAVGVCRDRLIRMERRRARESGRYEGWTKHRYTEEELQAIDEAYQREERRGSIPRYWEDVEIGQELAPVIKGPLTLTDMVVWVMGWGSPYAFAHGIARDYMRRHPGIALMDPETGVPDTAERIHWDDAFARIVGMPAAFDISSQRVSWFAHLITNWMGDGGFLKRLAVNLRQPVIIGDTVWCKGKVVGKSQEGDEHVVECELWGDDQRGATVSQGRATVVLPNNA